jgi:C1A family cysteine protease
VDEVVEIEKKMGWLPDLPDFRDFTVERDEVSHQLRALGQAPVQAMLMKTGALQTSPMALPPVIDLRAWMSPVEDQGNVGSCTANAGVGLVEYFERRAFGRHVDASRLFLYKATRNLLHWTGDTGAYLRTTMAGLVLFGVPPEEYWPYKAADYDKEPTPFCYAYAQNYQAISYYRLDPTGLATSALLERVKTMLASGLPSMFGFTVYSSIGMPAQPGDIPFPTSGEKVVGGHAIVAAGYDDRKVIKNPAAGGPVTTGALLIRNSWGKSWGDAGYGWLPYDYVLKGLAIDWWSLLKSEWVDSGQFGLNVTLALQPTAALL